MSGSSLWQIGIRLTAQGAEAVGRQTKTAENHLDKLAGTASKVADALGVALTVDAFVGWMKKAVDAGDEMKQFSQKTGVAVEEVAGLQLAFKQGGVEGDELTKSLGKMSKQMVEGNDAFDKMGVKTRNADGSLRSVKDVLYDVADAAAGMEDPISRAALMQEIFGKGGAALIPTMLDGSEGMRKMADMADRLGLSMSTEAAEAADGFNDTVELLGLAMDGVARRAMSQMLPTLNSITGALLESSTSAEQMRANTEVVSTALKGLVSAGVIVIRVVSELGAGLGAVFAAAAAAISGDFSGAMNIISTRMDDAKSAWKGTGETLQKVWSDAGDSTVEAMAKVTKSSKTGTVATKEQEAASKKLNEEYEKLIDKITQRTVEVKAETVAGRALTEAEKNAIEITAKYTGKKREHLLTVNETLKAAENEKRATEAATKARAIEMDKFFEEEERRRQVNEGQIRTVRELIESIEFETSSMKLGNTEREIAIAMRNLEKQGIVAGTQAYDALAASMRKAIVNRESVKESIDLLKQQADSAKKMNEEIGQSLTDALMQGGKSAWSYIKGLVRTTVLRPIVEMVAKPIAGGIMDLFGLAKGSGGASGGLGSLVSMFSSLGSAASGAWSYITGASAAGSAASGAVIGGGLEGGAAAGGMGGLSSIGMSIPIVGAIIAGMLGADKAYGMGYSADNLSYVGHAADQRVNTNLLTKLGVSERVANILTGGSLSDRLVHLGAGTKHTGASSSFSEAGGLVTGAGLYGIGAKPNDYSTVTENLTTTIAQSVVGILDGAASTFGKKAGYSVAAGFADDVSSDPAWGALSIDLAGQLLGGFGAEGHGKWPGKEFANKEEGIKQFITESALETKKIIDKMQLPEWARKVYDSIGGAPTFEQLAAAGVQVATTQKQLVDLGDSFKPLGGVLSRVADLSSDAKMQLVEFAGGIDALISKTQAYVQNYYSTDEQMAISAVSISKVLRDAGITTNLGSKEDLRALIESVPEQTEAGRKQLAALLGIAEAFAPVGEYLKEQGKTLDQLAGSAPQSQLINSLTSDSQAQTDIASQQLGQLEVLTQQTESTTTEVTNLRGDVGELQSTMLAVAENTRRMAKLFEGWNGTDGLNVVAVPT